MVAMDKKLLIRRQDVVPSRKDFEVVGVFNPGCVRVDNQVFLLLRVAERPIQTEGCVRIPLLDAETNEVHIKRLSREDKNYDFSDPRVIRSARRSYLTSMSHLRLAKSTDGEHFTIDERPTILPCGKYEEYGIEDPRITCIDGVHYICYSCSSGYGILVGLIQTEDFVTFTRKGYLFHPDNKDAAIFPQKINGKYMSLHRPSVSEFGQRSMWLAESGDLVSWGNHRVVICPRRQAFDSARVGAGCVPFPTPYGWLELYHGATEENVYAMGALLLDRDDPGRVLARTREPILFPSEDYETNGFFGNVVFSCGCTVDGDSIDVYYGAADEYVAKTRLSIECLMQRLEYDRS